jgi:hypothetical protein
MCIEWRTYFSYYTYCCVVTDLIKNCINTSVYLLFISNDIECEWIYCSIIVLWWWRQSPNRRRFISCRLGSLTEKTSLQLGTMKTSAFVYNYSFVVNEPTGQVTSWYMICIEKLTVKQAVRICIAFKGTRVYYRVNRSPSSDYIGTILRR